MLGTGEGWITGGRKKGVLMKTLTKEDKERLAYWENAAGLEPVADQQLFMDSHGCNVVLMVVRHEGHGDGDPLYGFTYRYSSEERFYEDDPMDLVAIESTEVVKIEYRRVDGEDWSDHI